MNLFNSQRFLVAYSAIVTLAFTATVLLGAARPNNAEFGTITVRRINVVEPDGTVRLTISNRKDFPGAWRRGKEYPRPDRRDAAGMLFMNDEGTELGGLIWGAGQDPNGEVQNHAHLSFDQYEENQVFAIDAGQEGDEKFSQLTFTDQGDYPVAEKRKAWDAIEKLPAEKRDAAWRQFFVMHRHDVKRANLGRFADKTVGLTLRDENGTPRAKLIVAPDGTPKLQFLDSAGKVVKEISAS